MKAATPSRLPSKRARSSTSSTSRRRRWAWRTRSSAARRASGGKFVEVLGQDRGCADEHGDRGPQVVGDIRGELPLACLGSYQGADLLGGASAMWLQYRPMRRTRRRRHIEQSLRQGSRGVRAGADRRQRPPGDRPARGRAQTGHDHGGSEQVANARRECSSSARGWRRPTGPRVPAPPLAGHRTPHDDEAAGLGLGGLDRAGDPAGGTAVTARCTYTGRNNR